MRSRTCCFTGHREVPFSDFQNIRSKTRDCVIALINEGYQFFGTGGALGFDTLAAQVVLELKATYPLIKLILVLPCRTQTRGWSLEDIAVYERIKQQADKVVYTSDEYARGCMHKRNRHLVDNSSTCVCYLTRNSGGTFYTVNYARAQGLRVIPI